ncbi:bifunctional alpha/beta hydrolase/OsmC family protein [Oceanibacterium hippocampi]|uniref:Alpha/beta hydrolase family protein n=1 Tax=Oceanibacterium hippocampi TaxID=745714 RepID=A0A1Y5TSU7_9PROT|nr:alpha/beta fold hydrolase [Oceanibacterium hippocampi]SLN71218.1 Alpha/beta hydrolase family protein [Oceanibacterium hippocampi]
MASRTFDFHSPRGYRLSGRIEQPETTPRGWAVFAHCFTCGKESHAAVRLARALAQNGIGVLRFDFAGLGSSDGAFAEATFAADVDDLVAAGDAMHAAGMTPALLVGHSLGGAAALAAAGRMKSITAVATIAAPADVGHVLNHFDPESLAKIETDGEAEIQLAGRPFVVRQSFVDDVREHDLLTLISRLHRPLLILHAPRDETVGVDNASRIFLAAKHPKSFVSLDGADHLLTRRADADYAAAMITAWATRYLPHLRDDLPQVEKAAGVVAEETGKGQFQLAMRSGAHRFLADEPESVGGMGSGLSPFEFVAAGLAACTTMTMRMYARRKGFPLEQARTEVVHSKRKDETPADLFTRTITLEGPLDDEQRERILAIADRCPVDLTLVRGSAIETVLTETGGEDPSGD